MEKSKAMEKNIMAIKDLNIQGLMKMVNQMEMEYYIMNFLVI